MIEGLILLAELVAMVLLLWTVQRSDTPGARAPTSLFRYRDPGRPSSKVLPPQGRSRSNGNA